MGEMGVPTHQLQHSQQAHKPQRRHGVATERHEAHHDDEEIEHVPRVAEEVPGAITLGNELDDDLQDENVQHDRVQDPVWCDTRSRTA